MSFTYYSTLNILNVYLNMIVDKLKQVFFKRLRSHI